MNELFTYGKVICYPCKYGLTGKTRLCYACKNGKTGETRYYDKEEQEEVLWECECSKWKCECHENTLFFCPICNSKFEESEHLSIAIPDLKIRWFANMVTHYRHNHILSWNNRWGRNGNKNRFSYAYAYGDYDTEKLIVNERAKRQIIRKCFEYMNYHGITPIHVAGLLGTEEATMVMAKKKLKLLP